MDPLVIISGLFTIVFALCGVIMTLIMREQDTIRRNVREAFTKANTAHEQSNLHEQAIANIQNSVNKIEQHSIRNHNLIIDINNKLVLLLNDKEHQS